MAEVEEQIESWKSIVSQVGRSIIACVDRIRDFNRAISRIHLLGDGSYQRIMSLVLLFELDSD